MKLTILCLLLAIATFNCSKESEITTPIDNNSSDEIQARGTVFGSILNANGKAITGATITLLDSNKGGFSSVTDTNGLYNIPDILTGNYTVTISHSYYKDTAFSIDIEIDEDVTLHTIKLTSIFGSMKGTIVGSDGKPIYGAFITLDSTGFTTTSDSLGEWNFATIKTGSYKVIISKDTYLANTISTIVLSDKTTETSLSIMKHNYGTLKGTILSDKNQPLEGVKIISTPSGEVTTTNALGFYSIAIADTQKVTVSQDNYYDTIFTNVYCKAEETKTLNAVLHPIPVKNTSRTISSFITGDTKAIDSVIIHIWDKSSDEIVYVKAFYNSVTGLISAFTEFPEDIDTLNIKLYAYSGKRISAFSDVAIVTKGTGDITISPFNATNACPQFSPADFIKVAYYVKKVDDSSVVKSSVERGDTLSFTVIASDDIEGKIVLYELDTNLDGKKDLTSKNGFFTYTVMKHYAKTTVTAIDNEGNRTSHTIMIYAAPNVIKISSNERHTLILTDKGDVWGCGRNENNQLGLESGACDLVFNPVKLPISNVTDIATGINFSLFLKRDNTLWGVGSSNYGELGQSTDISSITEIATDVTKMGANGHNMLFYCKSDSTLYGSGKNEAYQLGLSHNNIQTTLTKIIKINGFFNNLFVGENSSAYTFYNKAIGHQLYAFGSNKFGQLTGTDDYYKTPTLISSEYTSILLGLNHSIIGNSISILGTGSNNYGELGLPNFINYYDFTPISNNAMNASVGSNHTLYLTQNSSYKNTLWGIGSNGFNCITSQSIEYSKKPIEIAYDVSRTWGGLYRTFYVMADQCRIFSMGYNYYRELGHSGIDIEPQLLQW